MKTFKLQLLVLLLLISVNSCNKDKQHVLGVYYLEGTCKDLLHGPDTFIFPDHRDVIIKESNNIGLLVNISIDGTPDFKASISKDSLFIPHQVWKNFDKTTASFRGEGIIKNDSLFLHYIARGSFGVFDCDCKGEQIQ